MSEVKSSYRNLQVSSFVSAVASLYGNIVKRIKYFKSNEPTCKYINEWEDLFANEIDTVFVVTWFYLAGEFEKMKDGYVKWLPLLQNYGEITAHLDHKIIFNMTDIKWSKLLKCSFTLLVSSNNILQLWGHKMIVAMIPGLLEVDGRSVLSNTPHVKGMLIGEFKPPLMHLEEIVHTMLMEFK